MTEIRPKELKTLQLQILNQVDDYCTANGITYWLDSGTLIGAVRHGGYIPWDDDIDLGMLRPDFERFLRGFNGKNPRYRVACVENDASFCYAIGKVLDLDTVLYEPDLNGEKLSVNIDIFIYDNAPDDPDEVRAMYDRRDNLRKWSDRRVTHGIAPGSLIRKLGSIAVRTALKILPKTWFVKKMSLNSMKYRDAETRFVGNFLGYRRILCDKELLSAFVPQTFEGRQYPIPARYEAYLDLLYDDYRELPPPEQRVSHHKYLAFFPERASDSTSQK